MPKARLVSIAKLPLYKLIEENMDSIASGAQQEMILAKFMKYEEKEDELKKFILQCLKKSPPGIKELFAKIYNLLVEIDKAQDELIDDLWYYARHIERINALSNALLKRFDVRGKRRQHVHGPKRLPLFGGLSEVKL